MTRATVNGADRGECLKAQSARSALGLSEEQLHALRSSPWWASPARTVAAVGLYISLSLISLALASPVAAVIIWILQGFLLSCAMGAAHDCAHGTFARERWLNRGFGVFWALSIMMNYSLYRAYHLAHHRHTGTSRDTEPHGEFASLFSYFANLPTFGFIFSFWRMSALALVGRYPDFVSTGAKRKAVRTDSVGLLMWMGFVALMIYRWPEALFHWYLAPLIFCYPFVFITSLPEHYGCDLSEDIWRNTRTVKSNAAFRFLFWNGNFHAEHHLLPWVPSWNLPILHDLVGDRFVHRCRSYAGFHATLLTSLARGGKPVGPTLNWGERIKFRWLSHFAGRSD